MSSPHKDEKSVSDDGHDEDLLISKSRSLNLNDSEKEEQEITCPSKVKDRTHVYFPPELENAVHPKGGKWMLYADGDMDELNDRWNILKSLYHKGVLIGIKSSTSMDEETGITMCYTSNYEDETAVKRAADEIKKLIKLPRTIYYKTNEASAAGLYRKYSSKGINMYKYTEKGYFYRMKTN